MILSDHTLKQWIKDGKIVITPLAIDGIQPASIDCTLGDHFLIVDDLNIPNLDLSSEVKYRELNTEEIILPPHSFILATTQEYIKLPRDVTAFVEGRSSIGRMGLFVQNAGWVDPGFEGRITLELFNANSLPIKLTKGRRVCQLVFCLMDHPADLPYLGKYQGQTKSMGTRVHLDSEAKKS